MSSTRAPGEACRALSSNTSTPASSRVSGLSSSPRWKCRSRKRWKLEAEATSAGSGGPGVAGPAGAGGTRLRRRQQHRPGAGVEAMAGRPGWRYVKSISEACWERGSRELAWPPRPAREQGQPAEVNRALGGDAVRKNSRPVPRKQEVTGRRGRRRRTAWGRRQERPVERGQGQGGERVRAGESMVGVG